MSDDPTRLDDQLHDDEALCALLDAELAPGPEATLRDRIAREPALAARLAELARVDAALRSLGEPALPAARKAALRADLQRRIERVAASATPNARGARRARATGSGTRVIQLRRRARALAPLAAALAAGLALYLAFAPSPEQQEAPREAQIARQPAPAPAAAELSSLSDEEILIAIEYDTLEDFEVIEQLDVLELLAALDASGPI